MRKVYCDICQAERSGCGLWETSEKVVIRGTHEVSVRVSVAHPKDSTTWDICQECAKLATAQVMGLAARTVQAREGDENG